MFNTSHEKVCRTAWTPALLQNIMKIVRNSLTFQESVRPTEGGQTSLKKHVNKKHKDTTGKSILLQTSIEHIRKAPQQTVVLYKRAQKKKNHDW